jgi:ParB family chromosome partitioning protein
MPTIRRFRAPSKSLPKSKPLDEQQLAALMAFRDALVAHCAEDPEIAKEIKAVGNQEHPRKDSPMQAQRRLGRGLEALLGGTTPAKPHLAIHQPDGQPNGEPLKVSVYEIDNNPYQPRKEFDEAEIDQLAESLEQHGLLQPIVVRRAGERYQLISGERRLRAAIKAGWPDVPVFVRECDDRQLAELAIVENLQRKDLNPLEKAASFQLYLDQYDCTQEELAGRLAIDRSTVANLLRLLELPTMVQAALRAGAISQGHARALLPLGDDHLQVSLCTRIQIEGLSVRTVEEIVNEMFATEDAEVSSVQVASPQADAADHSSADVPPSARRPRTRAGQIASLEQELRSTLGTKVEIKQLSRGRGKIVIHYRTSEEFDRLREHLRAAG